MKKIACPEGLTYVSGDEPGYTRRKCGRGFVFLDEVRQKLSREQEISRIKSLKIPPTWQDVWISKNPKAHLQATGYDAKQRKQYLYHPEWVQFRQIAKFDKMKEFGKLLPDIRIKTSADLKKRGWGKEKVLALIIQVLDEYHIRIGNKYYKEQNSTYGLTTLRRKHLEMEKGVGRLEFKAKSGKYRKINLKNNQLVNLIRKTAELPGYEIFTYKDEDGKFQAVDSQQVNDYLHQLVGQQFSCKDFRTWGGTILTVEKAPLARKAVEENPRLKLETRLVKEVAVSLGNTVSICREYYIHPQILKRVIKGEEENYNKRKEVPLPGKKTKMLSDSEIIVLNLLNEL
ncbi:MAG: DNA topoisomerase IB [Cyclobacteriaceae bacterium]